MPVLLRQSRHLPEPTAYDAWMAVSGAPPRGLSGSPFADLSQRLEAAFDGVAGEWRTLAKVLAREPTSGLAHMPGCAPTCSDFGLMLAWSKLIEKVAGGSERVLVLCDDPWLFRHLAGLPKVTSGRRPPLSIVRCRLAVRGFLSRTKVALKVALASLTFRHHRSRVKTGSPVILVYGHANSRASGHDGYFGSLMDKSAALVRVLHTDGPASRAKRLAANIRTVSLHAWGNPLAAMSVPFARWRPDPEQVGGELRWLIERAVTLENSTGQGAMSRWQQICQVNWLAQTKPHVVAWPWENHTWERGFVRSARTLGVRTIGYLHTPHGRHHWGLSPASNRDGLDDAPDLIVCTGRALAADLAAFGYPPGRVAVGGSLRDAGFGPLSYDADGPVLIATPNHKVMARQMEKIALTLMEKDRPVLVRPHPMAAPEMRGLSAHHYTDAPFSQLPGLSAVVYTMSSLGLEGLLSGIPVIRFRPQGAFAPILALPPGVSVPAADEAGLEEALDSVARPPAIDISDYYAPADFDLWKRLIENGPPGAQPGDGGDIECEID